MTTWLSQNPIQFNGTMNVLNFDETAIGGKHKYHRGRLTKVPRWLFGIVDKLTDKIHLEFVTKKRQNCNTSYHLQACFEGIHH